MEGPLLTRREHVVDITIDGNSSSIRDQEGKCFWNPIEFVVTLVQIAAALLVLIQPKDKEHPQATLSIWIIGYTCGCIATLPIFCWRFWYYGRILSSGSTEEYPGPKKINEVMDILKIGLEGFFVGWFVVFLWNFFLNSSSLDDTTTPFFWLSTALLTFSCIRYVLLNLAGAVMCYLMPGILCVFAVEVIVKGIMSLIGGFVACICG